MGVPILPSMRQRNPPPPRTVGGGGGVGGGHAAAVTFSTRAASVGGGGGVDGASVANGGTATARTPAFAADRILAADGGNEILLRRAMDLICETSATTESTTASANITAPATADATRAPKGDIKIGGCSSIGSGSGTTSYNNGFFYKSEDSGSTTTSATMMMGEDDMQQLNQGQHRDQDHHQYDCSYPFNYHRDNDTSGIDFLHGHHPNLPMALSDHREAAAAIGNADYDASLENTGDGEWEDSLDMEELVDRARTILTHGVDAQEEQEGPERREPSHGVKTGPIMTNGRQGGTAAAAGGVASSSSPAQPPPAALSIHEIDDYYKYRDEQAQVQDRLQEFRTIEAFVSREQATSREQRRAARRTEACEERRLAAEVAQLEGLRLKSLARASDEDLRYKIANAERSYMRRKAVYAKAVTVAGAELRSQFARVREFLEQLHQTKHAALYKQHRRNLNYQSLRHALKGTDVRVVSLDKQIAMRMFRKKKADLNEYHMVQMLEEAVYLERMMNILDKVQQRKEAAAREMFELHVANLKDERDNNDRRREEFDLLVASGTLEMAKVVAQHTGEDYDDQERDAELQRRVEQMERTKIFHEAMAGITDKGDCKNRGSSNEDVGGFGATATGVVSMSKLFDSVIWSVATNDLGLTTTSGSSLYSSDFGSDVQDDDDDEGEDDNNDKDSDAANDDDDDGVAQHPQGKCLTPIGKMHARQLRRELRAKERETARRHRDEVRREQRGYVEKSRALRTEHQALIDQVVSASLVERERLREAISDRMEALKQRQEEATELMKEKDTQLMKDAVNAEDQRIQEAETTSFMKAQELISAQVFHEVRNALASVIAMSDMTNALKEDHSLSPEDLVASVDSMLDQIGDVVDYSLKMLNEILDVSKINSGAFVAKREAFDLGDVVARATRMQQAKASTAGIRMSFAPSPRPCIAVSDPGIVERLVATLISNAVKFTKAGAVQPFVWPLEKISGRGRHPAIAAGSDAGGSVAGDSGTSRTGSLTSSSSLSEGTPSTTVHSIINSSSNRGYGDQPCDELPLANSRMKLVAVGVADTGSGLSEEVLQSAKYVISTSTSRLSTHGAQNTGFGLYHAHLQVRALDTQLSLSAMDDCRDLLNPEMLDAVLQHRASVEQPKIAAAAAAAKGPCDSNDPLLSCNGESKEKPCDAPGQGTVLFFTLPVYEDCEQAQQLLLTRSCESAIRLRNELGTAEYAFRPQPSPDASEGCFRILVADDVLMLRKGMMHTICTLFRSMECPVLISTACTAEEVLRVARSEPFDLIVCDHNFHLDTTKVRAIVPGDEWADTRPSVRSDSSDTCPESNRHRVKAFFDSERFSIEENDGSLLGLSALVEIVESTTSPFPVPLLMLVSGHKIDVDPRMGIVVAQKPLKQSEFISSFEKCANDLYRAGRCKRNEHHDGTSILVNGRGSRIFVHAEKEAPS